MKSINPVRALAAGASTVTVALTAGAFWLSFEHLHEIADANGLDGARAWAWPGTIDAFIVVGELLILRAALRSRFDWFAYLLAAVGSVGSIALNVAGVGWGASTLAYVTAAVPPVAALLAFAAVMRQVHQALAELSQGAVQDTPAVAVDRVDTPVSLAPQVSSQVSSGVSSPPLPALTPAPALSLVICGDSLGVPEVPHLAEVSSGVSSEVSSRLLADAARAVIENCHVRGTSVAETAKLSTRSESYVKKVFGRLDEVRGEQPIPGQLTIVGAEVSA